MTLPINSSHQILSLATKTRPNFEKIDSGRRPEAIFSKFGLKKCLTTFANFWSAKTHEMKTSKLASTRSKKIQLKNFRRHFSLTFIAEKPSSGTTTLKNAPNLPIFCVQVAPMDDEKSSFMGQVWFLAPSCPLGLLKSQKNFLFFFFHHFFSIPPLRNHFHRA